VFPSILNFKTMRYLILIISASLLILSCEKEITIKEQLNHEELLFIECILYPEEEPKLFLNTTHAFFSEKVTPQETFERNAYVELSTDGWTEQLMQDSIFDKFRCRWTPFYRGLNLIEYGKTYNLLIHHNDETYMATTTIDQPKVNITGLEYTPEFFDLYGGHDGIIVKFNDTPDVDNYYRFRMDRWMDKTRLHANSLDELINDCTEENELFLTEDLGRTIFTDGSNDGSPMEFNAEVSFEYLKGDSTTIYLLSIDAKSAAFFKDLDDQLQSILNPFVEPSFLHSTIDGTLGVFGSAVKSDPVPFIYPQDNP